MRSVDEMLSSAGQITLHKIRPISGGGSAFSFSIVNSVNGKRVAISKALSQELGLTDAVEMQPSDEHTLLVGANLGIVEALKGNLCGQQDGKKICYSAEVVLTLCEFFALDYTNKTSRAFTHIQVKTTSDGRKIGIIEMK